MHAEISLCTPPAPLGSVGQAGPNGSVIHHVLVQSPGEQVRTLTFTQHSPDRYTVFGLSCLRADGISIERRTHEESVLMHDSSAMRKLGVADQWIAYRLIANSYYGAVAVGASPEQAYKNMFEGFSTFR